MTWKQKAHFIGGSVRLSVTKRGPFALGGGWWKWCIMDLQGLSGGGRGVCFCAKALSKFAWERPVCSPHTQQTLEAAGSRGMGAHILTATQQLCYQCCFRLLFLQRFMPLIACFWGFSTGWTRLNWDFFSQLTSSTNIPTLHTNTSKSGQIWARKAPLLVRTKVLASNNICLATNNLKFWKQSDGNVSITSS